MILEGHGFKGTLAEWFEFAKRDDCLDRMVPSDLRQIIRAAMNYEAAANSPTSEPYPSEVQSSPGFGSGDGNWR